MHDLSLGRRAQHVKAQIEDAIAYVRQPQAQPPQAQSPQQPSQGPQPPPRQMQGPVQSQTPQGSMAPPQQPQGQQPMEGGLQSLQKAPQSFAKGGLVRSVQSR